MKSIRRTLLARLAVGVLAGTVLSAALVYGLARQQADALFDYQMQQLAAAMPRQPFAPLPDPPGGRLDLQNDVVIQIWDRDGLRIYHSHEHPFLPLFVRLGFSTVDTPQGAWRVYGVRQGFTVVQVAQPMSARRALATRTALRIVAPLLLLLLLVAWAVWSAVGRGLAPLRGLAADLQARDARSIAPLSETGLPEELAPMVRALNALLARLERAIAVQRDFVADAAHELRTPLTALRLQMRLAERATGTEEREAAFTDLSQGLARATRLVQQLLTLARHEPGADAPIAREPVDLAALAREAVAEAAAFAGERGVELRLRDGNATVSGDRAALAVLLGNLVDNALRYTPPGGCVEVEARAEQGAAVLAVLDDGPGIPEPDLGRVTDRFYRVPGTVPAGSGLGLAIVEGIARAHGATLELANRPGGGLAATVRFAASKPAAAPAA